MRCALLECFQNHINSGIYCNQFISSFESNTSETTQSKAIKSTKMGGEETNVQILVKKADQSLYTYKAPQCKHFIDHSPLKMGSLFYGKCSACITDVDKGEIYHAVYEQKSDSLRFWKHNPREPAGILSLVQLPEVDKTWAIFKAPECRHHADPSMLVDGMFVYGNCATCARNPQIGNGGIYSAIFGSYCQIPRCEKYRPAVV